MSAASASLGKLAARFDAYSQRERALLACAVVGGVLLMGYTMFVDPSLVLAKQANRAAMQSRNDHGTLETQLNALRAQLQVDPDAGRKAEQAKLKAELVRIESAIKALEGGLVPPAQMNAVLERLLAGNTKLRLQSLKSLPPVNLADAGKAADAGKSTDTTSSVPSGPGVLGLYKHGVEIRLEGGYSDLHAWLTQLESTPQKILWGDVRLQVTEHPRAVLVLTIYTLSTEKAWLAI